MFSPNEERVLKALGKKKMSIKEVADKCYEGKGPLYPNNTVSTAVARINKKCVFHNLDWFINGAGAGRAGREIWRDER